jgi:hypothetical protein
MKLSHYCISVWRFAGESRAFRQTSSRSDEQFAIGRALIGKFMAIFVNNVNKLTHINLDRVVAGSMSGKSLA